MIALDQSYDVLPADTQIKRPSSDREKRFARLRAQIAATPPSVMADYQQETSEWEATELADASHI